MYASWVLLFKKTSMKRRNFMKLGALGTAGAMINNSKGQLQPIIKEINVNGV